MYSYMPALSGLWVAVLNQTFTSGRPFGSRSLTAGRAAGAEADARPSAQAILQSGWLVEGTQ